MHAIRANEHVIAHVMCAGCLLSHHQIAHVCVQVVTSPDIQAHKTLIFPYTNHS